jgi:RNA polymerase sigma-70 factor (ECF subfamily)
VSDVASEQTLSALLDGARFDEATTLALERYGSELLAFIHVRLRDLGAAREAYAWMAEDIWRGMPGFRRQCSMRTWVYSIARNAAARFAQRELAGRQRDVPISELSRQSALAVKLPSTDVHDRLARIRAQLDDDEQSLLTLRVDKNMDWSEVALVMLGDGSGDEPDAETLVREAARLRKRFQLLKAKLRSLAESEAG